NDGISGTELWKTDGTVAGTVLVKDIVPGAGSSSPVNLGALGEKLFFSASDPANGLELWESDGTVAGTVLVKDIRPGPAGSGPNIMTSSGGKLFFAADDGRKGNELWRVVQEPVAVGGGPHSVGEGGSVTLDGFGSSDPVEPAASLSYAWDLDGDGAFGETGA